MPAVLPAVLAVLFVAVVAVSVVLWGEREDEQPAASDTSAAMLDVRALAEDAATAFFTLDHRDADANIEAARALMTEISAPSTSRGCLAQA